MGKRNFTGMRDDSRNSFVGNGMLDAILMANLNTTDKGMVYLVSDLGQLAGEDARKRIDKQTITFASDGGTDAGLVTLKRYCVDETGTALASGVVVNVGGTDYTTGSGGVISHALDLEDQTVQGLLDVINALPGFIAEIGDALTSTTLDGDDIIVDMAETNIPTIGFDALECLKNDVSATNTAYLRIGLPTRKDRDPLQLLTVRGSITVVTGGAVTLYRDDQDEYVSDGSHLEQYDAWTPTTNATAEDFVNDNVLEGAYLRGPLVLKVAATSITGANYHVKYLQGLR